MFSPASSAAWSTPSTPQSLAFSDFSSPPSSVGHQGRDHHDYRGHSRGNSLDNFSLSSSCSGPYPTDNTATTKQAPSYRQSFAGVFDRMSRASTASTACSPTTSSAATSPSTRPGTPSSSSSASRVNVGRARHSPSKSLVSNFLATYPDEYPEPDRCDDMDTTSYTRSPRSNRTRQGSSASVTGWLSKASGALTGITRPPTHPSRQSVDNDPLLHLDLKSALFPHGAPDPLDPSSFHDLLDNAGSLIARLQSAYKEKASALADLRQEQAAQIDEMDEAETRARHLRMQLEDISSRAADQERQFKLELEVERQKRLASEAQWKEAVREEPGITRRRQKSSSSASDSGFESEVDSDAPVNLSSVEVSPVLRPEEPFGEKLADRRSCPVKPLPMAADLRTENQRLKLRVAELEAAVTSCLDLVSFGV
jgi:hypothetical protein